MILFELKSPAGVQFGSPKNSDADFGSYFVKQFGFFSIDEIEQAREGSHCHCAHDCCGCWQVDSYYVPIAFGFGYIASHHYMNV